MNSLSFSLASNDKTKTLAVCLHKSKRASIKANTTNCILKHDKDNAAVYRLAKQMQKAQDLRLSAGKLNIELVHTAISVFTN